MPKRTIYNVDMDGTVTKTTSGPPPPSDLRTWFRPTSSMPCILNKVTCLAMDCARPDTDESPWYTRAPYKICLVSTWPGKEQVRCYAGFVGKPHCLHYYRDLQKLLDVMWTYIARGYPTQPPDVTTCKKEKKVYRDFLRKVAWLNEKWEKLVPYDIEQFYSWILARLPGRKPKLVLPPLERLDTKVTEEWKETHVVTSSHWYDMEGMVARNFETAAAGAAYAYMSTNS